MGSSIITEHGTQNEGSSIQEEREKETDLISSIKSSHESAIEAEPDVLTGYHAFMLVFAISLAGFLYSLDVNIMGTAVPVITSHFHTIDDIGWYGSAYLISLCACTPLVGKIYQYYHAKTLFFSFLVVFEIGSLICGVAPSSIALIIGRAIAGVGGSGIFSGGLTIIALSLPKDKRAKTVAFVYVFSMLGSIAAPLVGGVLTEKTSWRWCFYINLPAGAITLAIVALVRIPDKRTSTSPMTNLTFSSTIHRLDPIGFILFAPSCVMILLALQWGGTTYAWNSSTVIGLFVGFAACTIAFICWEIRQGNEALVPLGIMSQRAVYSSCLVALCQFGSLQVYAYYLPVWFQTVLGVSPILSGAYFMATAGSLILSTIVTGIIASRMGGPAVFSIIGNAVAAIGGGLLSTITPSSSAGAWVGFQIISGLGRGMTLQQPVNVVQHVLDPARMAVGTSMVVFSQFFGGALALALAETDFSSSLRSALAIYAPYVDSSLISRVGAAGLRDAVPSAQVPEVLHAFNRSIVNTFYLGSGISVLAFLSGWGMRIRNQNKPSGEVKEQ